MSREPDDLTVSTRRPRLASLVPGERDVRTGRIDGGQSRQNKHRHEQNGGAHVVRTSSRLGSLVAVGAVLAVIGGGTAYAVVRAASINSHASATRTTPTTPTTPPSAVAAGSKTSAGAPVATDFDARGTLNADDVKFNGSIGQHYQTIPASLHISCSAASCTISKVRAPGYRSQAYLTKGLQRTLPGAGPWTQDDGALHTCRGGLHWKFRVSLTLSGTKVALVAKGYPYHTPYSDPHYCAQFASQLSFAGTKVG